MRHRLAFPVASLAAAGLLLAGCADAPATTTPTETKAPSASFAPVSLDNCGVKLTVEQPPTRLVTLNQGATEVALALGLEDRMAGTAYLDDQVSDRFKAAYDKVPVLAKEYPTREQFLGAKPDFAYAAYASAFDVKAVGTREELTKGEIGSYVSPFGCPKGAPKADATFESAWQEIEQVGSIFGVKDAATSVVDGQKTELEKVRTSAAAKGKKILWYDSGDKTPFVGGGGGGPQLIIDAVAGTNVFADLDGGWGDGSWEKVIAAQPDVIVLADASWDTAEQKKTYLKSDPVLQKLKAVVNDSFVVLPFSETTPGVRLVEGAASVSDQIAALPAS